jgi:hypothetical protein
MVGKGDSCPDMRVLREWSPDESVIRFVLIEGSVTLPCSRHQCDPIPHMLAQHTVQLRRLRHLLVCLLQLTVIVTCVSCLSWRHSSCVYLSFSSNSRSLHAHHPTSGKDSWTFKGPISLGQQEKLSYSVLGIGYTTGLF